MTSLNQRLVDGEAAAFAELYDLLADRLFRYLVTQTGSRDDAADLLQELFSRLFRARQRLGPIENLQAYCFRVARNEVLRSRHRHREVLLTQALLCDVCENPSQNQVEINDRVAHALNRLSPSYREVIELKFFSSLTLAEISSVIDKPVGTVATWLRRALEQMRKSAEYSSGPAIGRRGSTSRSDP